jgi:ABC-type nitrate/sulfonate/bicarbonate transport system substrate-binding protein
MSLREYFENTKGTGVLATADASGQPNVAIYARPHFLESGDDETISFIMADRASYANVKANPRAAYLYIENGQGYAGKRLSLARVGEESDQETIQAIRRRNVPSECRVENARFLVHFRVDAVRPLVGTD